MNASELLQGDVYRALVDAVSDYAIFMIDTDGIIVTWNPGGERCLGYKAEEIIGRHFSCFFPPEDSNAQKHKIELERVATHGSFAEDGWRVRKDGSRFWAGVVMTAIRGAQGELLGFAKVTRDLTEKKRMEAWLRHGVESAPTAMLMVDPDGYIVAVNAETERLFGYHRSEMLGEQIEMLMPGQFRAAHPQLRQGYMERPKAYMMARGRDLHAQHKNGSQFAVEINLNPVPTNEGTFVLASIVDIRERKHMEAMLREANDQVRARYEELECVNQELKRKNEEVEGFVYIVSHDLRAPLVNLQGFSREIEYSCNELSKLLFDQADFDPKRLHEILGEDIPGALKYLTASAAKFERLIDALLQLSRHGRQEYRRERLEMNSLVGSCVDSVRHEIDAKGIKVGIGPLPPAYGDATAIGQVFSNLIGNAIKYFDPARPGTIQISGEVKEGMAHYWVHDNGIGIPEAAQSRLFQVFQRFHPEHATGEGMGLATVKRIIERHGGEVWAVSRRDEGSTFHLTLPMRE